MNRDNQKNTSSEQEGYDAEELRGVIVVDTNILYNLYAGVEGEFRGDHTFARNEKTLRRYLDALRFLSKHGYEVIIPEMVSYEAENMLIGGRDVDQFFPRGDDERNKIYRGELKKFLREAAGGKRYPHIRIFPSYEPQEVANFLHAVHDIVDHTDKPSPQTTNRLVKLQQGDRRHFGDKAIAAMLSHNDGVRSFSKHFFVLSDDHDVLRDSARYNNVNVVNTMGFLDALMKSGIWEGVGLSPDCKASDVMESISTQAYLATGGEKRGYTANIDHSAYDYRRYLAGARMNILHPFEESLHGLYRELGWKRENKAEDTSEAAGTRIEAFSKKYGCKVRPDEPDNRRMGSNDHGR